MHRSTTAVVGFLVFTAIGVATRTVTAQPMAKAQVANLITKVENGVDEFRNYLEKRGDNARDANAAAPASGRRKTKGRH